MAKPLLTDELWERIKPSIPPEPPEPRLGRPRVSNRACLTGIIFVLRTGTPWEYLPQEMGCGCGMTCWRLLRDWQEAGVWDRIWGALPDESGQADEIDWSAAVIDSCSTRAFFGRPLSVDPQLWLGRRVAVAGHIECGLLDDRRSEGETCSPSPCRGRHTRCSRAACRAA